MTRYDTFLAYGRAKIEGAQTCSDLYHFLYELRDRYEVANIIYNGSKSAGLVESIPLVLATCDPVWIAQYNNEQLAEIDPFVSSARHSMLPVEWQHVDKASRNSRYFFSQIERFNVGIYGVTVPLEGRSGERGYIAMSHIGGEDEWHTCYHQHVAELSYLGRYIHDRTLIIKKGTINREAINLSRQSAVCLELLANGSDAAEIAFTLGLSVHTVRKHLNRAMATLGCKTKMEAILKASRLGFLPNAICFLSALMMSSVVLDDIFADCMIIGI